MTSDQYLCFFIPFWFFIKRLNINGFSVRVFGFIFLVCKVEGAVIDARDHNAKICSIKNIGVVMPNLLMSSLSQL